MQLQPIISGLTLILILGVSAQWIAWRLHLPSILVLLLLGFGAGPVTGILHPDLLFQDLLFPIVSISVAVILFEGGLTLKLSDIRKMGRVIWNLVTVGILVTWGLATWGAVYFLKFKLPLALLLGAVFVVTGPTVIIPMLKYLRMSSRTGSILKWEAMLNDPIGAILAILVFEAILAAGVGQATEHILGGILRTIVFGCLLGFFSARFIAFLLRRYWIPDFLQSVVTLMVVLAAFVASNFFQAESGLVAVTIMGMVLANEKNCDLKRIIEFKENLRVLLISSLFIILAARLDPNYLTHIGLGSVFFLLFLVVIVRPAAVLLSAVKTQTKWPERLFLSGMAPRGIVAAAVSSVFALRLEQAGYPDAEQFVAVTFFIVASSVALYGLSGSSLARLTKVATPNPQGLLIIGAHSWAQKIALAVQEESYRAVVIDSNHYSIFAARSAGLTAFQGNILSETIFDEVDLDGIGKLVALTANNEVNSLAALHHSDVFDRSEVFQLAVISKESGRHDFISPKLHGRFLFHPEATFDTLSQHFRKGAVIRKKVFAKDENYDGFLKQNQKKVIPLFLLDAKELKVITADLLPAIREGQKLIYLDLQTVTA